jgi:hypothetical protein
MPTIVRLLIGFAAALLAGWVAHDPLGRGALFLDSLQAQTDAVLRGAAVPGVTASFSRNPLSRTAWLSGPANDLQRDGQGGLQGINQRVAAVSGVSEVRWTDEDSSPGGMPLLAEMMALVAAAFLLGLGIGKLVFRPRRTSFL